jgi:hypothetical protein
MFPINKLLFKIERKLLVTSSSKVGGQSIGMRWDFCYRDHVAIFSETASLLGLQHLI